MSTKESKKIVKTYNRIARTIVEFETLWHIAWGKSIDASKAGLQVPLRARPRALAFRARSDRPPCVPLACCRRRC